MSKHVLQEPKKQFDRSTSDSGYCPGKPDPDLLKGSPTIDLSEDPDVARDFADYEGSGQERMVADTISRANLSKDQK